MCVSEDGVVVTGMDSSEVPSRIYRGGLGKRLGRSVLTIEGVDS